MAYIFMALWVTFLYPVNRGIEYRGMGPESPDSSWGKIIFFVVYVVLNELGKKLDKNPQAEYACPSYCDVDHIHIRRNNEAETKSKPDPKRYDGVYGPTIHADRK